jgi:hypothetical protein
MEQILIKFGQKMDIKTVPQSAMKTTTSQKLLFVQE